MHDAPPTWINDRTQDPGLARFVLEDADFVNKDVKSSFLGVRVVLASKGQ
jgi:hypothetical protein